MTLAALSGPPPYSEDALFRCNFCRLEGTMAELKATRCKDPEAYHGDMNDGEEGDPSMKARVVNSWGYLTYHVGDQQLEEMRGGQCGVHWPDGTVDRGVQFVSQQARGEMSDHGHPYKYTFHRLLLVVNHHGHRLLIPIEAVDVENVQQ